jgi:hypothetical protein
MSSIPGCNLTACEYEAVAMRAVAVVILSLWTFSAMADELPTNLLLKCEGKVSIIITLPKPDYNESKFETMVRLKDGELSDTDTRWLTTNNCALRNGVVFCSAKLVVPIRDNKGSERRELESYITRETGEYDLFLETWDYDSQNASGKATANMKLHRKGICRQISKPVF